MQSSHPGKNLITLQLRKDGPTLTLSSLFDSGNMATAEIGLNGAVFITPANDCASKQTPSHAKGWFHFSASGPPLLGKVKFVVRKMSQLSSQLKFNEYFRPVFRTRGQEWQRLEQATVFVPFNLGRQTKQDDVELHFEYAFTKQSEIFFAFTFPFSFAECEAFLKSIVREAKGTKGLYYRDQVMVRTQQGRAVHLLTVSSTQQRQDTHQPQISEYLFQQGERPLAFKDSKRVVMISARVHPAEVPSSHTFNGLLKFLLSNDARAYLLRKHFVFKLIPMLNPDGVYHGHYRMDTFGQNLNRFYQQPCPHRQPSVFAVKQLGQYYGKRLCFYLDLHAHPQRKGNFIYGNAMETPQEQVQTQLFAKLLSINCPEFDYPYSCFSKYHMNAKDKNQDLSKEGCGRVVFNTHFQLSFAYTLECGYTASGCLNEIVPIQNAHRVFDKHPIIVDDLQNLKSSYYCSKKNLFFTIRSYQNLGKNSLVSLLDLFQLNPASRLSNTQMKNLNGVRKQIVNQLNRCALINKEKFIRLPINKPALRLMASQQSRINKGLGLRAPSIESSKDFGGLRMRNRTIAKVNIGLF